MEMLVDSFAGGGGASTGIRMAMGREVDIAINHDPEAISLHAVNHPNTVHYCESVYKVDPIEATGGRPVGLFWASPDCRHFSKAKGGAPTSPRVRGLAWIVIKWAKRVAPRVIMLENVEEFSGWGPLGIDGRPCEARMGMTYRLWTNQLRGMGYQVEARVLRACDYGAPTSRKRLFVIARRDGAPIVWPMSTHGPGTGQPWRTAAECIDWSIEAPSIFGRERPLAEATMARIAEGVRRYVLTSADPFIVGVGGRMGQSVARAVDRPGQAPRVPGLDKPLGTVVAGGRKHALVTAFLSQNNTGMVGHDAREPISTIVGKGSTQSPITVSLGSPDDHREDVTAFLIRFYSSGGQWSRITDPTPTITTRDRIGLVTVHGREYRIVDIGLRMLTPRELYRAQGFPEDYAIDVTHEGKRLSKAAQVRMCGNSVSPPIAAALVAANLGQQRQRVAP